MELPRFGRNFKEFGIQIRAPIFFFLVLTKQARSLCSKVLIGPGESLYCGISSVVELQPTQLRIISRHFGPVPAPILAPIRPDALTRPLFRAWQTAPNDQRQALVVRD